jgi:LPS export ABC transporter protein LptC
MSNAPRIKIVLLTLLLAVLALWITDPDKQKPKETVATDIAHLGFNWQATDTTIWQLSKQNDKVQTIIQTSRFSYAEQTQLSSFVQPEVTRLSDNQILTIKSNRGSSLADLTITFDEQVKVVSKTINEAQPTLLTTEKLTYYRTEQKLSTDDEVIISNQNVTLSGEGFEADLRNREFRIYADVKSQYNQTIPNRNLNNHELVE